MTECPKCGCDGGYYEKRIQYGEQYFDWDGTPCHYVEQQTYGGKRTYCADCGKDITKAIAKPKKPHQR